MATFTGHLLVDGYSVIHAWKDLKAHHERRLGRGREELISRLLTIHDAGEYKVTVVFDGQSKVKPEAEDIPGDFKIYYTAQGQTADMIIERLVAVYPHPEQITVVTNDHAEQMTVESLGAHCISCESLHDMLERFQGDQSRALDKIKDRSRRWNRPS